MANHRSIKSEPGRNRREAAKASKPIAIPAAIYRGSEGTATTPSEQATKPFTVSDPIRGARSNAPSVTTRRPPISAAGDASIDEDLSEDMDDDPILMEVRGKPTKAHPDEDQMSASQAISTTQVSFVGPNRALKDFGKKLKDINDALGELQARGIQHVASLPELVLVGDQSSGKSSLMSAIAGLSLPRSTGTCTRCPIHIRISRADAWSCRVFLKRDYDFVPRGHLITTQDVTKADKFPPWVLLEPVHAERYEFKSITDRFDSDDIETILRCAQVAILNPSDPHQMFIPKLKGETSDMLRDQTLERVREKELNSEAQFSPNTVALEVRGPELADLNFYDLPGVFLSAKRPEDKFLERVVQNLACEYISRPNAMILWAAPMNQDAENSFAFNLIREMKAEERCIGVMTKADLLPTEASASWMSMLKGQAHKTGFGYFITSRQGTELEEQTKLEEAFFNRTADNAGQWPGVFEQFKDRCGVEKLKAFLSLKLGEEFSKVLPEVKAKVNNRLYDIDQQLKEYPDSPPNPELEIMRSLSGFSLKVKDLVLQQEFLNLWDSRFVEPFKAEILNRKPRFKVQEPPRKPAGSATSPIDLDSPESLPARRKRPINDQTPTAKRQRQENGAIAKSEYPDNSAGPRRNIYHSSPGLGSSAAKSLCDIRDMIKRSAIPGQPGLVSPSVYQPLYTEAAKSWDVLLDWFIENTVGFINTEITRILEDAFFHLKNRLVYQESVKHIKAFIEDCKTDLRRGLFEIYSLETRRIFTKDDVVLSQHKAMEKKILTRHRYYHRIAAHHGEKAGPIPKMDGLTDEELAQEAVKMQRDLKTIGPDEFDQELTVAAYVRGYYLTAAHRFIDNVSIRVMSGLLPNIASVIDNYLYEKLELGGRNANSGILERLMSEGPEIAGKRLDFQNERKRLEEAMEIIVNLESKEGSSAGLGESTQNHHSGIRVQHSRDAASNGSTYSATQYGEA
ncbi:P-loop containing nucleoside triphosphate hydrolase protein [Lasiosphaeria miniovina]|uniref:P-loop containing nucleoside triphosphate hydrolase protein n=1 Tax=Lasiosphaeria miniovina TaxID=1954250 RepID=A0AA40A694_9PEZI|nr:P-loop containing nucleoside triphosphate hydrolase protein [Lasiosphaeria miniovina]KAK0710094.1 P-loop containing nucleoside triphosphate hydrolase protein [Lasiosphaeria miniovina]